MRPRELKTPGLFYFQNKEVRKNKKMKASEISIKRIDSLAGIETSAAVIRDSFKTVAGQFGLTPQNCPAHPSFITPDQLTGLYRRGLVFFGLFLDGKQVGFTAIEKAENGLFYLEKLAVLPGCRHRGFGRMLVTHALEYMRANMGQKVSIGIIDNHTVLKNWYLELGFKETGAKKFAHLPFTVCFMEMEIHPDIV
jgi:diamine N-acetyltransferase